MEKSWICRKHVHQQPDDGPPGEVWMSWVKDQELLSNLSIPGTHDSAAYTYRVPFISTQRMDIQQQLDAGVRYFDLRCGLRADVLEMVHGPSLLGLRLDDVLAVLYAWLSAHPSEALIVQLKQDRIDDKSTLSFAQAVVATVAKEASRWRTLNTTPSMGELRGRIQLFRRFRGTAVSSYGINVSRWQDNPQKPFTLDVGHSIKITVQDHYRYNDAEPLPTLVDKKMNEILQLSRMASSNDDARHWYISFTSALEFNWTYRYPPREVAEGGWFGFTRVPGVNDRLCEHLQPGKFKTRYGILAMDFPDSNEQLISNIIRTNFARSNGTKLQTIKLIAAAVLLVLVLLMSLPVYSVVIEEYFYGAQSF
ncbi:hypothetical protein AMS68_001644 [Peltaster fructicola]|uniref:Phosphatidylinositol-specific phospholipase C X domain-containing protein n=1 Tax=Peltaster fructicola TaxID=286661 RepID=A0A6H0XMZ9_9PEZI|nr:hypothetical protein AMS68_001644 [Peltaster fructicola]